MNNSPMYSIYQTLYNSNPNMPLTYDEYTDSLSLQFDNCEVRALSNNNCPMIVVDEPDGFYKYEINDYNDTMKFLSDLVSGNISFTFLKSAFKRRLKIDGWVKSKDDNKQEVRSKVILSAGLAAMIIGALLCLIVMMAFFDDGDDDIFCILPLFLGLFVTGLRYTVHNKEMKISDAIKYFGGMTVTTLPISIIAVMFSEMEISLFPAALFSAFFCVIGWIVRSACLHTVKQHDDVFLKFLPGPSDNNRKK
ncbi:MAG: hypothetical protein ILP22_11795 [Oscillospiraceae bacterium]|nr:hypothetical protein [Oscillospiraceae bacterium]